MSSGPLNLNTSTRSRPDGTGPYHTHGVLAHRIGRKIKFDLPKSQRFGPNKYNTTGHGFMLATCNMYHFGLKYKVHLNVITSRDHLAIMSAMMTAKSQMKKAIKLLLNTPSHHLDIMIERYNETHDYRVLSIFPRMFE